jgi:predicted O-methyltransferase YrrM
VSRPHLIARLERLLGPTGLRTAERPSWVFADDVLSAVTRGEAETLARLAAGGSALEIGSYFGRSTIAMASCARVVHAVDPHDGGPDEQRSTLEPFLANLERYGVRDRVVVHVGLSVDVVPRLEPATFDVVFVDAMHQRPEVDRDLALAARRLAPGAALALHDYGVEGVMVGETWHGFGVTEAVDEFVARAGTAVADVVDTLAVVRSPSAKADDRTKESWRAAVDALPVADTGPPT